MAPNQDFSFYGSRIFFIGAHPDDIELGAGAFIARVVNMTEVYCITLSDNQKNPLLTSLKEEHYRSMATLGVKENNIFLGTFETRRFPHFRQEILEYLINLNRTYKPELVFIHTRADIHQDHNTVTEEALRAFRGATVLGFDVIRSSNGFFPHFLVEVGEEDVQKKLDALAQYQTYQKMYYFNPELTRSILVRNGSLAERKYAEGFDILRIIGSFGLNGKLTG